METAKRDDGLFQVSGIPASSIPNVHEITGTLDPQRPPVRKFPSIPSLPGRPPFRSIISRPSTLHPTALLAGAPPLHGPSSVLPPLPRFNAAELSVWRNPNRRLPDCRNGIITCDNHRTIGRGKRFLNPGNPVFGSNFLGYSIGELKWTGRRER